MVLGYAVMGLTFIIMRFFYHILPKKGAHENLLQAVRKDWASLCAYVKGIIFANPKIFKAVLAIMGALLVLYLMPRRMQLLDVVQEVLAAVMYFLLAVVFSPQGDGERQGFPVEIFGFTYSVILMYYSAGNLVIEIFYTNDFFREEMWLYGYCVTVITYVVCIATLKGFMERKLTNEEIVLLGMIMLTTLEFITYYGIGFFSSMETYDPKIYEESLFGNITSIVNKGIYIASQSQILERSDMEVWGNIILNGTDVLTITAVLGYVMQKFMEK